MHLLVVLFLTVLVVLFIRHLAKEKNTKNVTKPTQSEKCVDCSCGAKETTKKQLKILFGTQTGTAKEWAYTISEDAKKRNLEVTVIDLATYDPEDLALETLVIFVIPTYADGSPPDNCISFFNSLKELASDFKVHKTLYNSVKYGIFGIGNSVYQKKFNLTARKLDRLLQQLAAHRIGIVGSGDNGAGVEIIEGYEKWAKQFWPSLQQMIDEESISCHSSKASSSSKALQQNRVSDEPDEDSQDEDEEPLVDLEDMGGMLKNSNSNADSDDDSAEDEPNNNGAPKQMLTPSLRKALTKQGYKLLGSHSGVKICRWTKAMLRGRGGCYKHTFYGIQSFQCMEMTPSLACANKCVFCWRHHKNPVGTEWRWEVDSPEQLVESAVKNHQSMIKQMKGVPGVSKEKYDEAFNIRHCALSLVGEPIIYPHINKFIELLHKKKISSFMVTNAQFPDKIVSSLIQSFTIQDELQPVTQLYISVDAATKESLKKVDRPIFADFWERFLACIDSLSKKGQRTVFRLTLIKEWNMEEIRNYSELVQKGRPSFIEIKGVTYCGTSKASTLTMKNVPFHEEVIKFGQLLIDSSPFLQENYELCCEHEHSCCILIAQKQFKVNGVWNTWIDYDKFHELIASGQQFTALDYMYPTPKWALVGSEERGFDPEEIRFKRNKSYQKSGC